MLDNVIINLKDLPRIEFCPGSALYPSKDTSLEDFLTDDEFRDFRNEFQSHLEESEMSLLPTKAQIEKISYHNKDHNIIFEGEFYLAKDVAVIVDLSYRPYEVYTDHGKEKFNTHVDTILASTNHLEINKVAVYQPQCHHEDGSFRVYNVDHSMKDLFYGTLDNIAKHVRENIYPENGSPSPHCLTCPKKGNCSAFTKYAYGCIELAEGLVRLTDDTLTRSEQEMAYDKMELAIKVLTAKKKALEAGMIEELGRGEVYPNYIIKEKLRNRKWKEDDYHNLLDLLGEEIMYEQKRRSPAQVEKWAGKKNIAQYTERPVYYSLAKRDPRQLAKMGPLPQP